MSDLTRQQIHVNFIHNNDLSQRLTKNQIHLEIVSYKLINYLAMCRPILFSFATALG